MTPFTYVGHPARVIFGTGTIERARSEAERLGMRRALVLTTPQQAGEVARMQELLGDCFAAGFSNATMHTPVKVTEAALAVVAAEQIDGVVAIGGGSTIGLGKAIALRTGLPQLGIPTTYAGSEMTDIIGETADGAKKTQRTPAVLPETVIYDVALTLGMPRLMTITSGLNSMAHAVEALYAPNANPITALMAEKAIAALYAGLPRLLDTPEDASARADTLLGAWLSAVCLGVSEMSLHHKLCHVLGGSFDLPHAETHSIVLPHALAYNASAARDAVAAIKRAMGGEGIAGRIFDLAQAAGAPVALKSLGMAEGDIARAVEIALANPYANPRPLEPALIARLIRNAWEGVRPDHATYAA